VHLLRLSRLPRLSANPLIAVLLAVALWFASTMGLVHGVVHVPGAPQATEQATKAPAASAVARQSVAKAVRTAHFTGFAALFADHADGDAQCRLYDQLSHGPAAIAVPLIVLPLVLPTATFDFFQGEVLARWVALFQARGPPSSR
jgi:hypothetical protein